MVTQLELNEVDGGQHVEEASLELSRTSVDGMPFRFRTSYGREHAYPRAADGTFLPLLLGAVSPGEWSVRVMHGHHLYTSRVVVRPGETAVLQVDIGEKAMGYWKPLLRFDGRALESAEIYLQGGDSQDPEATQILWENGRPPCLTLPSGDYIAWIPGMPPLRFRIEAGQTREDVLEVPVATVTFSADDALFAALNCSDIRLELEGAGAWYRCDFLDDIDAKQQEENESYQYLTPRVSRIWSIPPGDYYWQLSGGADLLAGEIRIPVGSSPVHFSLSNLPGVAVLEVYVPELAVDSPDKARQCSIDFSLLPDKHDFRIITDSVEGEIGPDLEFPGVYSYRFGSDRGARRYVAAPPGTYRLQARSGDRVQYYQVVLPGSLTIHLHELDDESPQAVPLLLTTPVHDPFKYRCAIRLNDMSTHDIEPNVIYDVSQGPLTLHVSRAFAHSSLHSDWLSVWMQIVLGPEGITVGLDTLLFQANGTATITCRGRGDPGNTVDPWWMAAHPQGPRLYALWKVTSDDVDMLPVYLNGADHFSTAGGVPEFRYTEVSLPPGRYRAIPWRNASAKYCREFTIQPGEHTNVLIEGGK